MKNSLYFFIFITLLSCDSSDNRLRIINNTNHTIFIGVRLWVSDTLEYSKYDRFIDYEFNENQIESNDTLKMSTKGSWINSFQRNNTMVLLVFNKAAFLKMRRSKSNKKYDIELEQLIYVPYEYIEKNGWTIKIDSTKNSKVINL